MGVAKRKCNRCIYWGHVVVKDRLRVCTFVTGGKGSPVLMGKDTYPVALLTPADFGCEGFAHIEKGDTE